MNSKNNTLYYALFLVWPFASLYFVIQKFREPVGRILLVLLFSYLGFTVTSEGDLERYEEIFYLNKTTSLLSLAKSFLNFERPDIYTDLLSTAIGRIFNSHHFYFAALYAFFGFFYSGVLVNFLKLTDGKIKNITLSIFLGFALYYSVRSTISIRFYTGAIFFLYTLSSYLVSKSNKYLVLSVLTPLFHFSLALTLAVAPLFMLIKNQVKIAFILVVASFFIGQSTIVTALSDIASENEDTFFEQKYNAYADEEGRENLDERYAEGFKNFNVKAKSLDFLGDFIFYLSEFLVILLFVFRQKFVVYPIYRHLFVFVMLLLSLANLMQSVSNGERFIGVFIFTFLGFSFLIQARRIFTNWLRTSLFFVNITGLLFGLASLYAANPLFTFKFFLFNYFTAILNL